MNRGLRIKQLRERIGMPQVELAHRIGVSKQTLYKYENNIITNIPSDKIVAIAKELGTTPQYIMGWISDGTGDEINDYYSDQVELLLNLFEKEGYTLVDVESPADPILLFYRNKKWYAFFEGEAVAKIEECRAKGISISVDSIIHTIHSDFSSAEQSAIDHAKNSNSNGYYTNPDTAALAQEMFDDPDMRILYDMKRTMDPERFKVHMEFMKELYKQEHPDNDEGC